MNLKKNFEKNEKIDQEIKNLKKNSGVGKDTPFSLRKKVNAIS